MKSPNYVAVLALLNAMLHRVSESMPQIDRATRALESNTICLTDRAN
jgi:hypothetical protein